MPKRPLPMAMATGPPTLDAELRTPYEMASVPGEESSTITNVVTMKEAACGNWARIASSR